MSPRSKISGPSTPKRRRGSHDTSPEPHFIPPCLPQPTTNVPTGESWLHEIKYDGYRVQALLAGGNVRLVTRTGLDWSSRFGRLASTLTGLDVRSAAIDGEAIVVDATGISDYGALTREMGRPGGTKIVLMAFDLLFLDGHDVKALPLIDRKTLLRDLLQQRPHLEQIRFSEHMLGDGPTILANACKMRLEGIVSKRADLPYRSGRLGDWTKSKCALSDPFVVIGYVGAKGASESVGSLLLGYFDGANLKYAGRVGSGFSQEEAHALWGGLSQIRTPPPSVAPTLTREQRDGVTWVEPRLVAQVAYTGWTDDRVLRHARLKHFRDDKTFQEIGPPLGLAERHDAR